MYYPCDAWDDKIINANGLVDLKGRKPTCSIANENFLREQATSMLVENNTDTVPTQY